MKSAVFASVALACGALVLGGCGSRQEPSAKAGANARDGITVDDGRLVLPAVKGNPGAVYFTLQNDTGNDETIESAVVKGAQGSMIHQTEMANGMAGMHAMPTVAIPAKGSLAFKPGGLHVMAMGLDDTLAKGGTTEVTLTFASGKEATFPVAILAAGDAR